MNPPQNSDDLRTLLVYPLPSRIDGERESLRSLWRHGGDSSEIEGYQVQFERVLREAYALEECALTAYFDEVQIQHSPDYSYGEKVAAQVDRMGDSLSILRGYGALVKWLQSSAEPWENPQAASKRVELSSAIASLEASRNNLEDVEALARAQEESFRFELSQRDLNHPAVISAANDLALTRLQQRHPIAAFEVFQHLARSIPFLRSPLVWNVTSTVLQGAGALRSTSLHEEARDLQVAVDGLLSRKDLLSIPGAFRLLQSLAKELTDSGCLLEARLVQERLLSAARVNSHEELLAAIENMATVLRRQRNKDPASRARDVNQAKELLEEALSVRRSKSVELDLEMADVVDLLADTLLEQVAAAEERHSDADVRKAATEARNLLETVVRFRVAVQGDDNDKTLCSMGLLAAGQRALKEFTSALRLQILVYLTRKRQMGSAHPYTLAAMCELGITRLACGQSERALTWLSRVAKTRTRMLGYQHPDTVAAVELMATAKKLQIAGQFGGDNVTLANEPLTDFYAQQEHGRIRRAR